MCTWTKLNIYFLNDSKWSREYRLYLITVISTLLLVQSPSRSVVHRSKQIKSLIPLVTGSQIYFQTIRNKDEKTKCNTLVSIPCVATVSG